MAVDMMLGGSSKLKRFDKGFHVKHGIFWFCMELFHGMDPDINISVHFNNVVFFESRNFCLFLLPLEL